MIPWGNKTAAVSLRFSSSGNGKSTGLPSFQSFPKASWRRVRRTFPVRRDASCWFQASLPGCRKRTNYRPDRNPVRWASVIRWPRERVFRKGSPCIPIHDRGRKNTFFEGNSFGRTYLAFQNGRRLRLRPCLGQRKDFPRNPARGQNGIRGSYRSYQRNRRRWSIGLRFRLRRGP